MMKKVFPYDFTGDNEVGLGRFYKIIQGKNAKNAFFPRWSWATNSNQREKTFFNKVLSYTYTNRRTLR